MAKESGITSRIMDWLKELPMSDWDKNHGSIFSRAGRPDISGTWMGVPIAFEVKNDDGVVSPIQERHMAGMRAAGVCVCVVRSLDEVKRIIEQIRPLITATFLEHHPWRHFQPPTASPTKSSRSTKARPPSRPTPTRSKKSSISTPFG